MFFFQTECEEEREGESGDDDEGLDVRRVLPPLQPLELVGPGVPPLWSLNWPGADVDSAPSSLLGPFLSELHCLHHPLWSRGSDLPHTLQESKVLSPLSCSEELHRNIPHRHGLDITTELQLHHIDRLSTSRHIFIIFMIFIYKEASYSVNPKSIKFYL